MLILARAQAMWARAFLDSCTAVTACTIMLGVAIVPWKAHDIWPACTLSFSDCYFHAASGQMIAAAWTHHAGGRVDHLVTFRPDRAAPAMASPWGELHPRVLAHDRRRDQFYVGDFQGRIWIVDLHYPQRSPHLLTSLPYSDVKQIACSQDGRWLVAVNEETLVVCDLDEGGVPRVLDGLPVHCVAFVPDTDLAVGGLTDGRVVLIDLPTREPLRLLARHSVRVLRLAICPAGKRLVSMCVGGQLQVTDLLDDRRLWERSQRWIAPAVAFSADGETVLTAGRVAEGEGLVVRHATTGNCLAVLAANWQTVRGVGRAEDGRILAWGSDGTLRVWEGSGLASWGQRGRRFRSGRPIHHDRVMTPRAATLPRETASEWFRRAGWEGLGS